MQPHGAGRLCRAGTLRCIKIAEEPKSSHQMGPRRTGELISPSHSNQCPERGLYMAGFQVIIYGRFWVFTEDWTSGAALT
jgi:hypothetical protein